MAEEIEELDTIDVLMALLCLDLKISQSKLLNGIRTHALSKTGDIRVRLGRYFGFIFVAMLLSTTLPSAHISVSSAAEEDPRWGGSFTIALNSDPLELNPALTSSAVTHHVCGYVFNRLMDYDFDFNPKPELAESWEISDDGLTVTLHLVRNATWHDGVPFTSADVKYSFEEVLRYYHTRAMATLAALDVVETPDAYTAVIKLNYPFAPLMLYFDLEDLGVIPKHLYEGTDPRDNEYNLKPIGTGPYKFVEYVKGSHIILERNDNYWKKDRPYLDKVMFKIIPDPSVRVLALEAGEIDAMTYWGFPYSDFERLNQSEKLDTIASLEINIATQAGYQMHLNLRNPILADIEVRRAIAHLFNMDDILEKAYYGLGAPMTGPFPSASPFHNPNTEMPEYDPDMAEQLLDGAGYTRGTDGKRFSLRLVYNSADFESIKIAELSVEEFRNVGIDLILVPLEYSVARDTIWKNLDFDLAGWRLTLGPDPNVATERYYHTKNIKPSYYHNCMNYNNSRIDELYDLTAKEVDVATRTEYFWEIQEILVDELPIVWLVETMSPMAWNAEFKDFIIGPWGFKDLVGDRIYWTEGTNISPSAALAAIEDAEDEIADLEALNYDVTESLEILDDARDAYDDGDWEEASQLAEDAVEAAVPPVSAAEALAAINDAEEKIASLEGQFYDVREARSLLDEARDAYDIGDYQRAFDLANEAVGAAVPPYWLYGVIVAVIAVAVIVGVYWYRKGKKT